MKILTKDELDQQLGKDSFWKSKPVIVGLSYLSGFAPFDEKNELKSAFDIPGLINIKARDNGMEISLFKKLKYSSIAILKSQILSIHLEDREQIFEKKEKSVIGRAIIGGVLLGPVGALVGGLSGTGEKEVKAKMPELILTIKITDQGEEKLLVFSCKYGERRVVDKFFMENYKSQYYTDSDSI